MEFQSLLILSALLRLFLILYGEWQDTHMEVRYTDIDYVVFSDAASLVASGRSPYDRSTYRYSPLLAFLLVPNSIFHPSWGKFIFSASDLLVGLFMHTILKLRRVPEKLRFYTIAAWLFNPFTFTIGTRGNCEPIVCAMVLWVIISLMNGWLQVEPLGSVTIELQTLLLMMDVPNSSRLGRSQYLINGLLATSRYLRNIQQESETGKWFGSLRHGLHLYGMGSVLQAAFWYGLLVHFRIYPIIYSLPIILVLDSHCFQSDQKPTLGNWSLGQEKAPKGSNIKTVNRSNTFMRLMNPWFLFTSLLTRERILFGFISGSVFFFWTALFFYLYGWEFLNEALLYHLTRTDPRHNFSIYFYHIYLHHEQGFSVIEKLISFLPQLMVQLVFSLSFAQDLPFCLFMQTVAFVAFNKVITAQYFVWFFCLLPLILPWSNMKLKWKGAGCVLLWMGAQIHWLMWGYLLEFKGKNVFIQLWLASILFLAANTLVLIMVIRHHRFSPIFIPSMSTDSADTRKIE